jgi:heterodisulfide reductase subunit A
MIGLTIDGKKVEVEEGTTLLNAAKELGIDIPTLCYHPAIEPYQVCRVCLVEITKGGKSQLVPSCGYKAEEGMGVKTNSEIVIKRRKLIVELILAEAPNSEKVKEIARKLGIEKLRFESKREKECILCGLCVRACNELMGIGTIAFAHRGADRKVTTPYDEFNDICSTCGACAQICPTGVIKLDEITQNKITPIRSSFDADLSYRPCIYVPFPQAVPNKPVIDRENCVYFKSGNCKICEVVCQPEAIRYDQEEEIVEEEVGAIIVATGYDLYGPEKLKEYGYGVIPDVVTSLQFERILSATGPTVGEVKRPSDGKVPKRVVFIQCAGSRDKENHLEYCSKICCMYTAKHALLYKHRVHDGEPIIFYIDVRTSGKGYEEFYNRVTDEGAIYIRGKVSKVYQDNGKIIVLGADTLSGKQVEVEADMVVLATGMIPAQGNEEFVRKLKIQCDVKGFLSEAHPKLRPVESQTSGIFLAGAAQGPKDIPEVVAQASGAASKAIAIVSQNKIKFEPTIAGVDEDLCSGCSICVSVCPFNARELDKEKMVVKVTEALCQGCGSCSAACPSGAAQQRNLIDRQIEQMVESVLEEK